MSTREDIKSQQALLAETQLGHLKAIRETGILATALAAAGIEDESLVNPTLYRVSINTRDPAGPDVRSIELRLHTTSTGPNGVERTHPRRVAIAQELGGMTLPVEPFTDEQAAQVKMIMDSLGMARDMGLLPDLGPSMDTISDPYTALMRVTPLGTNRTQGDA